MGGPEQWGRLRSGLCKDFISATVQGITYPWQRVYSDKYVFSVSVCIGCNRTSPCTNFYDDNVCPRLHPLDNKRWIGHLSRCGRSQIKQEGMLK